MLRTSLAVVMIAAALGLTTNAHAVNDEEPNGTSLSGISASISVEGVKLQADAQDAGNDIEDTEPSDDLGNADRGHIPG